MSTAPTTRPSSIPTRPGFLPNVQGPPTPITVLGLRWPGPGRSAGLATLISLTVAAMIAALSLPLDRPGIGWLITALAGTAALIVAKVVPDRSAVGAPPALVIREPKKLAWDRYAWGAATIALLAVGTFRAAGWLFVLCVLVAILTTTLALTGGHSLRAIFVGGAITPAAALRAPAWLRAGFARLGGYAKPGQRTRIGATVAVSIALLTVFGALFASADHDFARILEALAPSIDVPTVFRWIFVFVVSGLALGGIAYLRAAPPDLAFLDKTEGRKVGRFEWVVPLGLLVLLFAAFVAVQLAALFGGNSHVLSTSGLTYADYARGGFWQLSFVTALTLVVLAGGARWAPREKAADRVLLRALLGSLAGLTLVVVASALLRIYLYTETYGLTRLRLLVACCEGWFGLVLIMVLVAGVWIHAPWLPRAAIAAGVFALLGLAVANPDGMIAANNIKLDRSIDWAYLSTLSPDAVPALTKIDDPRERLCVLGWIRYDLQAQGADDWRGWNLGRVEARDDLIGVAASARETCA